MYYDKTSPGSGFVPRYAGRNRFLLCLLSIAPLFRSVIHNALFTEQVSPSIKGFANRIHSFWDG